MGISKARTQKEREKIFWERVEKTDTCWLWRGGITNGYGYFGIRLNGVYKSHRAHRVAWILTKGPLSLKTRSYAISVMSKSVLIQTIYMLEQKEIIM